MGGKASNNFQADRPESGGADRDDIREKSEQLYEKDKQKYVASQAEKQQDDATGLQHGVETPRNTVDPSAREE